MKHIFLKGRRVLAVYPCAAGLAYALFQDANSPLDWAVLTDDIKDNDASLRKFVELLKLYEPDTVVLRDVTSVKIPSKRIVKLVALLEKAAKAHDAFPYYYSREHIRSQFAQFNATTKGEIFAVIAQRLPELTFYQPANRKCWESETTRGALFDAVSLALTHFGAKK